MDSNEQNNISEWPKNTRVIAIIALISFMFIMSINSKKVNLVSLNTKGSKNVFNEQRAGMNIEESLDIRDNLDTLGVFKNSITNTFTVDVDGYLISLIDNTDWYMKPIEERYPLLQEICNSYVNVVGLDAKNIMQIDISGNIYSTLEKERVLGLKESGEIANEIYSSEIINNNLSGLKVKVKVVEPTVIEPEVIVNTTDELYLGNSNTIEGVEGKSIIYKELVYDGINKSEENTIGERIVKPVVNTVVTKGIKNPYYDGIAFLSSPTNGGYISSTYGEVRGRNRHKGIDIAEDLGEAVNASFDGRVIKAGYDNGGYGNLVIIEHDSNITTYYAHLNEIYVKQGDIIKQGDVVGAIGSTGNSTGPHLHFELRVNDNPVDPIKYISK